MTGLSPTTRAPQPLTLTAYPLPQQRGEPDGTRSSGDLWRILWHHRWLIAMTALALLAVALLYSVVAPPLYTASAEIIIDPRDQQVMANDVNPSVVAPDGGITQIESQARVVESSNVLLLAIANTQLIDDPEANGASKYPWLARLLGEPTRRTEAEIQAATLRWLQYHLSVKRADKVFVVDVVMTAHDAAKAARLANAVAEAYLADQAAAKAQAGERASASLTARLDKQRARVEAAENAIESYKSANNIISAGGQLVSDQRSVELSTQLTIAQSVSAALRAKVDQAEHLTQSVDGSEATAEALQSPVISQLRQQVGVLVSKQADLEAQLGPRHPFVTAARMQVAQVRKLISIELGRIATSTRADYDRALRNQQFLAAQLDQARAASHTVADASVRLRELQRDLEADRAVYAAFLVRAQETREQAGIDTTNARIITRAVPPHEKSWPPLGLLLAGGAGSGMALGGGLALILEYLRPTILSRSQIEMVCGAPVIGVVLASEMAAYHSRGTGGEMATPNRTAVMGALRGLFGAAKSRQLPVLRRLLVTSPRSLAAIGLALWRLFDVNVSSRDVPALRSLLITSGAADRVRRRQICQLFAAAARMRGDRVLLVDADLNYGEMDGSDGLLEILQGISTLDMIVTGEPVDGVALLRKGRHRPAMPGNTDWIGATKLLSQARSRFDVVIVDGGVLADNLAAAAMVAAVDEVLLVARIAGTTQSEVVRASDAAAIMGRQISAIVLVDPVAA